MMVPRVSNIFELQSPHKVGEQIVTLLATTSFRLEHIISNGEASKMGCWYDQADSEWVVLVRGEAQLKFEGDELLDLRAGDSCLIPAHWKHRVESCSQDAVWLALHFRA